MPNPTGKSNIAWLPTACGEYAASHLPTTTFGTAKHMARQVGLPVRLRRFLRPRWR
jgi:hypothetical protein